MRALVAASLFVGATAHGLLTLPTSRNHGRVDVGCTAPDHYIYSAMGEVSRPTGGATIPGEATLTSVEDLTMGSCQVHGYPPSMAKRTPWHAPGSAPVELGRWDDARPATWIQGPCGHADLPETSRVQWQRGSVVDNNHGGGYAYRLCPAAEAQTEECFQRHHLSFVDNTTTLRHISGTERSIPNHIIAHGTSPPGSQWMRNPIPTADLASSAACSGYIPFSPPCSGCVGDMRDHNLVDRVKLSESLPIGDYILSWRWDTEFAPQIWLGCADVTITDGLSGETLV